MSARISHLLTCLLGVAALAVLPLAQAQQQPAPKSPKWTHAFDLKCRSVGEAQFSDKTKTFGLEVFRDENNGNGFYIIETGGIAATASGFKGISPPIKDSHSPEWMHGLDLKVRKAGETKFTDKTKVVSMELFRDANTGNWIYITADGHISVGPGDKLLKSPTAAPRSPVWVHGLDLKCRKVGEKEFTKDTKVWSIECFRDENNGVLVYACESGSIAIIGAPEKLQAPISSPKAPEWLHGLDLKCRKVGEKDFTRSTKVVSFEVFRDANTGNWLYISDNGHIAVAPGDKSIKAPAEKLREPLWVHGLDLKCRKVGEKDFTDKTKTWSIECFNDENTNCTVYVCESGALSLLSKKK